MLQKFAKFIRFLTVPPIVVSAELFLLLFFEDVFPQVLDFWLALICLAIRICLFKPKNFLLFPKGAE